MTITNNLTSLSLMLLDPKRGCGGILWGHRWTQPGRWTANVNFIPRERWFLSHEGRRSASPDASTLAEYPYPTDTTPKKRESDQSPTFTTTDPATPWERCAVCAPTAARDRGGAHIMCQPAQRVKEVPVGSQDPASPHRTTRAARASNQGVS